MSSVGADVPEMCLSVYLGGSPQSVGCQQRQLLLPSTSCAWSSLLRIQPIRVIARQRQGPQLLSLRVGPALTSCPPRYTHAYTCAQNRRGETGQGGGRQGTQAKERPRRARPSLSDDIPVPVHRPKSSKLVHVCSLF